MKKIEKVNYAAVLSVTASNHFTRTSLWYNYSVLHKRETLYKRLQSQRGLDLSEEMVEPLPNIEPRSKGMAHTSDDEYDTDLEDFILENSSVTQHETDANRHINFYLNLCDELRVLPISSYTRNITNWCYSLNYWNISELQCKALSKSLQMNNFVTKLEIKENFLTESSLMWISDMIKVNTSLKELTISNNKCAFTIKSVSYICEALAGNKTLESLDLSQNDIDKNMMSHLSKLLEHSTTIRLLSLSHNRICGSGGELLAKALTINESLQCLDLSWNQVRGAGAITLANSLQENCTLKVLVLAMNGFGNEGAAALGKALQFNRSLVELDLSNNRICIAGAAHFGKLCAKNDTLQILKMGMNPVQSYGSFALIKYFEESQNLSLRFLDLSNVTVLGQFMQSVKKIQQVNPKFYVKVGSVEAGPSTKLTQCDTGLHNLNPLRIVMTFMESQKLRIIDLFKRWDKDGSLSLSRQEFKDGLKSVDTPLTESQLDDLIAMLDGDQSGEIELNELMKAIDKDHRSMRRKVKEAVKKDASRPSHSLKRLTPYSIFDEIEAMLEKENSMTFSDNSASNHL